MDTLNGFAPKTASWLASHTRIQGAPVTCIAQAVLGRATSGMIEHIARVI